MAGRMAVGRDADHGAVSEQVVFAVDLLHRMAMIEVGAEEADLGGQLGILSGLPFALLHDHGGIGHQLVTAGMVEMQMRIHDEIDFAGIAIDRLEARLHVVLGTVLLEPEDPRDLRSQTPGGIGPALRMHAGIEHRPALGVFDQIGWNGQRHLPVFALDHVLEAANQPPAGHGVEPGDHRQASSAFLSSSFTTFGLALPPVDFMTWPTNQPNRVGLAL